MLGLKFTSRGSHASDNPISLLDRFDFDPFTQVYTQFLGG